MPNDTFIRQYVEKFKDDPEFVTEQLMLEIGGSIVRCMKTREMSRSDLAKKLKVSRAYVTQLLNGKPNLTIRSLAALGVVLEARVGIEFRPSYSVSKYLARYEPHWKPTGVKQVYGTKTPEAASVTHLALAA